MTVHINGSKGKDLYYGGTKIKEAYYNGNKVYSSGPLYYCYQGIYQTTYYIKEASVSVDQQIIIYTYGAAQPAQSSSQLDSTMQAKVTAVNSNNFTATIQSGGYGTYTYTRYQNGDLYT